MNNYLQVYLSGFYGGVQRKLAEFDPYETVVFPTQTKTPGPSGILNFGFGSALGDTLLGMRGWSNYRAGKAEAMGAAVGEKIPFNVKRPKTSNIIWTGAGMLGGAAIGAGIGSWMDSENDPKRTGVIGLSAYAGGISGFLLAGLRRRQQSKKLVESYNRASRITPILRSGNVFSILSGAHDRGRQDAVMAMRGERGSIEAPGGVIAETIPMVADTYIPQIYNKIYARGQQSTARHGGKRIYDY